MTEKTFHLFIIFHKTIYDECYRHISQEDLDAHFTFIAVNESIPKTYTPNKYRVINEWEMPVYNPRLQQQKYLDNSVLYHMFANQTYTSYDFIGFFQYDMPFLTNVVDDIRRGLANDVKAFYGKNLYPEPFQYVMHTQYFNDFIMPDESDCLPMMAYYEKYFDKTISRTSVYPYCNTFVIESAVFEKIMTWLMTTYDMLPVTENIASIYERLAGIAIGEEYPDKNIQYLDIIHDRNITSW
jgi:hypothetical protein